MTSRRAVLSSAVWSVPVIAVAIASPAAAASVMPEPPKAPVACHKIKHSGPKGHTWVGTYSDGSTITMTNGDAMSGPFGKMCRASGSNPGAGDGGKP